MAGGFRLTEDGNRRVTEASDLRVTENFESGAASISAAGSITASAALTLSAEFTSDGTEYTRITEAGDRRITEEGDVRFTANTNPNAAIGSVMLVGVSTVFGRANLSGTGSLAAEANLIFSVDSAMSGAGSQTAAPLLILAGLSNLSASGTIAADALFVLFAETVLTGTGSLTSSSRMDYSAEFESIQLDFTRITESGDRRVLENGDVRITDDVVSNSAEGVLVVFSDRIAFSAEPYVKILTDWKAFTPYVKHEDNWKVPDKMYKHANGNWKRIY